MSVKRLLENALVLTFVTLKWPFARMSHHVVVNRVVIVGLEATLITVVTFGRPMRQHMIFEARLTFEVHPTVVVIADKRSNFPLLLGLKG